ncbi:four helix bundle protein [Hoylesella buccalis]|uniref:four helix bundle protein n=1 Tax=Hoylesella buccalis TaxID=28127 RepID=UPI002A7CA66C|nr:four helix bundle protein [Prevotella sp.]
MSEDKIIENDIYLLSKEFALRIVNLYRYLTKEYGEYVLSKQLLRSGTSIGANVHEGKNAQSRPDFTTKMNIALKEATETEYWIDLLYEAKFINEQEYHSISNDCARLKAVLIKIVKATKGT